MSTFAVVAGVASAATWALGSHLFARLLARHDDVGAPAANLFKNGLSLLVFASAGLALGWPLFDAADSAWLLLSGLLGFAVGDALYFAALPRCGVQLAAMSGNAIPPSAALFGFLFLDETLPPVAFVAMACVIAGVIIVLLGRAGGNDAARAPRPMFGFSLALGAAFVQTGAIIAGRGAMADKTLDFELTMSANVMRLLGGVLGAFVIAGAHDLFVRARRVGTVEQDSQLAALAAPLKRGRRGTFVVAALVAATVNLPLFTYALGALPAGISSILFATTPLWTLPIGMVLGQRYGAKAYLGTAIAFVGLAVLVDPFGWFAGV